jgi:putative endonuclease
MYTGVTNDIERRVQEHKLGKIPGFTQKYKVNRLVYYEEFSSIYEAIAREKAIKGLLREKKRSLIKADNPTWADLSEDWFID